VSDRRASECKVIEVSVARRLCEARQAKEEECCHYSHLHAHVNHGKVSKWHVGECKGR
jgi:hypothetical protein